MPYSGGSGILTVVSGGSFTPANLANLLAWYKADVGVWNDAGATIPATNGATIARWDYQSGHAYNLNVSATQPTYVTGALNSLPVINNVVASSQTGLSSPTLTGALGTVQCAVFCVVKWTVADANGRLVAISNTVSDTAANSFELFENTSLTDVDTYSNGFLSRNDLTAINASNWNEIGTVFDGANNTMWINNVAQSPVVKTDTLSSNIIIGVFNDGSLSNSTTGQIAEVVITKNISGTEISNLHTYFLSRWGV